MGALQRFRAKHGTHPELEEAVRLKAVKLYEGGIPKDRIKSYLLADEDLKHQAQGCIVTLTFAALFVSFVAGVLEIIDYTKNILEDK